MSPKTRNHSDEEELAADEVSGASDNDGCVAEESASAGPATRRKAAAPRQAAAGKKAAGVSASSAADGEGAVAAAERFTCSACEQTIENPSDVVMRGTSSVAMHRDCLNATTYLERHIRQAAGPDASRKFKSEKPAEFRYRVLDPLAGKEDCGMRKRRGPAEKARALELAEEVIFYSTCFKQQYVLFLSERAFNQWFSGSGLGSPLPLFQAVRHVIVSCVL